MTALTREPGTRCSAFIGSEPTDWGFRPVRCGQVVATRGYWARTEPWEPSDHFVTYCAIRGHRADVERRFPARDDLPEPPEPEWLHEQPEYADPVTAAKWEADHAPDSRWDEDSRPGDNREGQPEFNGAFDQW